jgi:hypothetical protein
MAADGVKLLGSMNEKDGGWLGRWRGRAGEDGGQDDGADRWIKGCIGFLGGVPE